jgi:hypothetical protein
LRADGAGDTVVAEARACLLNRWCRGAHDQVVRSGVFSDEDSVVVEPVLTGVRVHQHAAASKRGPVGGLIVGGTEVPDSAR